MALSQLQCLDDNHVNPRTNESKPEFLYCEDQRLALETLLQDGREAFLKYLEARGLRGFLSDPELDAVTGAAEPFDPGSEVFPEDAEEHEPPLSLHYWPELSDMSIPQMDLGWPDREGYRGVTRTTMYSQPPLEGQTHIKEIVRKMIAQAQRVVAVVMDVFTDVDIFRDLLEAGFKRKISVYILLEHVALPHFLSMCQRASMHAGHLKNLRVRCTEGLEFHTRSSTKVKGRMGHRFMFIDGDKAVSGSYSFTWMSSRLDRNHITVVTGQAVEGFDTLFRTLYMTSRSVNLRQVTMEPEPEPEPLPQPASVAPPPAAIARKLYNPKYALLLGNPSPTSSAGENSPKKTESPVNSKSPEVADSKTRRQRRLANKEAIQEPPPLHPGLTDLEKAHLIEYLPTWPEPDPPSDVIGFINIRDANKPAQVHLQRSEMFGTSQAIRFSSPFNKPEETLPEVAKPRQLTGKQGEMNKPQPAQEKTKAQPTQLKAQPADIKSKSPEQNSTVSGPKCASESAKTLNAAGKPHSNTPTNQDAGHNSTPHLNAHTPTKPSTKASSPLIGRLSDTTNNPESVFSGLNAKEKETSPVMYRMHSMQTSHLPDSNTVQHTQTKTDSRTHAVHTEPRNSSEITPNTQISSSYIISPSLASTIGTQSITSTITSISTSAGASSSSINPPLISTTAISTLPSHSASSPFTGNPPIPKPRTIQLVMKDSDSSKLPDFSVARRSDISTGLQGGRSDPPVTTTVQMLPKKEPDIVPVLQNNSGSKTGPDLSVARKNDTNTVPEVGRSEPVVATAVQTKPIKEPETVPVPQNNSGGKGGPDFGVTKRTDTNTTPAVVRSELSVATMKQTSPKKEPETVPALQNHSKTGPQKVTENAGNVCDAPQHKQGEAIQDTKTKKVVGLHDDRAGMRLIAGTNLETQSEVLTSGAPKAERMNTQEKMPKDVQDKSLTSVDSKLTTQKESVVNAQPEAKATERAQTGSDFAKGPNETSKNVTQRKTYRLNSQELQTISYSRLTPQEMGVLDTLNYLKASKHSPASPTHGLHTAKNSADDSTHTSCAVTQVQQGNPSVTPAQSLPNTVKNNPHSTSQEVVPKAQGSTPEKSMRLNLSSTHTSDLRLPTPERESRSPIAPTPDGLLPRTPTPDSRTHTPDPRSHTPDFRTPTSDISDGYVTPRADSALSMTSEEYYECSDSPLHEPVFDRAAYRSHGATEDHVSFRHTNTPNAATVESSPACIDCNASAATLDSTDRNTSSSETQSLSGPASISSVSSLREEKAKLGEKAVTANEVGTKGSVAERTEGDSQGSGSKDAKPTAGHLKEGKDSTETEEKNKEAQPQVPKRRKLPNQSTPGESTSVGAEPKRWSTGDLKAKNVSTEGERPDKEKALGASGVERKSRTLSARETEGQKVSLTPPRTPRAQQQDSGSPSPSRPSRPARPLSANPSLGPRPWASRQPNQPEHKVLHSSFPVLDNTASPRRPPSRPPPPTAAGALGPAAWRKQGEVSHSQQSLFSRQPPPAQSRPSAGQSPNQQPYPKPQASFLQSNSNVMLSPHQTVSAQEEHGQEEGKAPFGFSFGRLYSLKGLKDKMSRQPAQSKRGSTSSAVQGRKSTS